MLSNSNFNKSALKKVVKDYNAKDVKKHIDILAKRVEKHFTEDKASIEEGGQSGVATTRILLGVWNACETEFVKLTESWVSRISQVYGDSGVSLEYTVADAESAFRRQKFGS